MDKILFTWTSPLSGKKVQMDKILFRWTSPVSGKGCRWTRFCSNGLCPLHPRRMAAVHRSKPNCRFLLARSLSRCVKTLLTCRAKMSVREGEKPEKTTQKTFFGPQVVYMLFPTFLIFLDPRFHIHHPFFS